MKCKIKKKRKEIKRKNRARLGMKVVGVGMLAGAAAVLAIKRIFDEIFVEDDWSDVDWGDDEEEYEID